MAPRGARALVTSLITHGREAGTPDAVVARRAVSQFLTEIGYDVQEHAFRFNAGVYRALPISGALFAAASLIQVPLLLRPAPTWAPAVAVLILGALLAMVTLGVVRGDGGPACSRMDGNLIASRPGSTVRCWLVAHLDTKAQAQSMAGRLWTVWVTSIALGGVIAIAVVRLLGGAVPAAVALASTALGVLGGILLTGGRLAGSSPGARDNGSGLLAVLTAAELSADGSIGVVITGAEEFGLVGARSLVRDCPSLFREATVLNVDTVDDAGTLFVVTHDRKSGALAGRVLERLAGLSPVSRERRLPLGIMVDSVPLSLVARETVTVGRLNWATLQRIHTPRDDANGYPLATAEQVGERLALRI